MLTKNDTKQDLENLLNSGKHCKMSYDFVKNDEPGNETNLLDYLVLLSERDDSILASWLPLLLLKEYINLSTDIRNILFEYASEYSRYTLVRVYQQNNKNMGVSEALRYLDEIKKTYPEVYKYEMGQRILNEK